MEQIFEPVSKKYLLDDSLVFGGVADSDIDAAAGAAGSAAGQNLGNDDLSSMGQDISGDDELTYNGIRWWL